VKGKDVLKPSSLSKTKGTQVKISLESRSLDIWNKVSFFVKNIASLSYREHKVFGT
jgi:hypothetical protein